MWMLSELFFAIFTKSFPSKLLKVSFYGRLFRKTYFTCLTKVFTKKIWEVCLTEKCIVKLWCFVKTFRKNLFRLFLVWIEISFFFSGKKHTKFVISIFLAYSCKWYNSQRILFAGYTKTDFSPNTSMAEACMDELCFKKNLMQTN